MLFLMSDVPLQPHPPQKVTWNILDLGWILFLGLYRKVVREGLS